MHQGLGMTDDHASAAASCWRDSSAQPTECWRTKVACFCAMRHPEYRALVLVLVAKHWRNLDSRATGITSYHLELLCMEAVRQCGSNVRGQFRCLLERFASGDTAVNNPNRFNRKVLESGRQVAADLADYAAETLDHYRRHLRPGNRTACPLCGERRFLSGSGAVAHLESGSCVKCRGQESAQKMGGSRQTQQYLTPMITNGSHGHGSRGYQAYQCTHCDRTFARLSALMQHMQDRHQKTLHALGF